MNGFHSKLMCLSKLECLWPTIWKQAYFEKCPFAVHYGFIMFHSTGPRSRSYQLLCKLDHFLAEKNSTVLKWFSLQKCKFWGGFVEHLSLTSVAQHSVTNIIFLVLINLVTSKAPAKHELFVEQTGLRTLPERCFSQVGSNLIFKH